MDHHPSTNHTHTTPPPPMACKLLHVFGMSLPVFVWAPLYVQEGRKSIVCININVSDGYVGTSHCIAFDILFWFLRFVRFCIFGKDRKKRDGFGKTGTKGGTDGLSCIPIIYISTRARYSVVLFAPPFLLFHHTFLCTLHFLCLPCCTLADTFVTFLFASNNWFVLALLFLVGQLVGFGFWILFFVFHFGFGFLFCFGHGMGLFLLACAGGRVGWWHPSLYLPTYLHTTLCIHALHLQRAHCLHSLLSLSTSLPPHTPTTCLPVPCLSPSLTTFYLSRHFAHTHVSLRAHFAPCPNSLHGMGIFILSLISTFHTFLAFLLLHIYVIRQTWNIFGWMDGQMDRDRKTRQKGISSLSLHFTCLLLPFYILPCLPFCIFSLILISIFMALYGTGKGQDKTKSLQDSILFVGGDGFLLPLPHHALACCYHGSTCLALPCFPCLLACRPCPTLCQLVYALVGGVHSCSLHALLLPDNTTTLPPYRTDRTFPRCHHYAPHYLPPPPPVLPYLPY